MTLRVMTFNIHKGLNFTSRRHILPEIKHLLQEADPDIIFLQEVQGEHHKRKAKFTDWPEVSPLEYLAGEQWKYHYYGQNCLHDQGHHGNALLSKFPLHEPSNTDISTSNASSRGLLYSIIKQENGSSLHLICTHFGLFKKERKEQFKALNNFIESNIPFHEPLILAGDFNDWRSSALQLLKEELLLTEVFHNLSGQYAKSFPTIVPLLKVDRIYYRGLTCHNGSILHTSKLSDHCPLLAEFE